MTEPVVKHGGQVPVTYEMVAAADTWRRDIRALVLGERWLLPDGWMGWPARISPLPELLPVERFACEAVEFGRRAREAWWVLTGQASIHNDEDDW